MVDDHGVQRRPFHRRRPLACCCLVLFSFIILVAVIIVILAFTLFKPKKADVSVESIDLLSFNANLGIFSAPSVNLTLGVVLSVHNPNRASFKYTNTTANVYYHDDAVAVVPVPAGAIGAQGTERISTQLVVLADRLVTNSHLISDVLTGSLPFTTETKIPGRVKVLFIKRHIDITSQCSVEVSIASRSLSSSDCKSKVDL